jgi:hypothetical protein
VKQLANSSSARTSSSAAALAGQRATPVLFLNFRPVARLPASRYFRARCHDMDSRSVVRWREVNEAASIAGLSLARLLALRSPRRPNVPLRNSAYPLQISNRQPLQLLESSLNHWKQTIAPRSNRQFSRVPCFKFHTLFAQLLDTPCRANFELTHSKQRMGATIK